MFLVSTPVVSRKGEKERMAINLTRKWLRTFLFLFFGGGVILCDPEVSFHTWKFVEKSFSRLSFQIFLIFIPTCRKWSNLTNIVQMAWFNHQLALRANRLAARRCDETLCHLDACKASERWVWQLLPGEYARGWLDPTISDKCSGTFP